MCADTGQQFLGAERLDQIVVGPGLHALDPALLARAGRQHDDRQAAGARVGPQCSQQAEAVEPGHHHVGQDQVRRLLDGRRKGRLAIRHGLDPVMLREQAADVLPHVGVVVGHQHAGPVVGPSSCGGKS